jgi:hypothetical protein
MQLPKPSSSASALFDPPVNYISETISLRPEEKVAKFGRTTGCTIGTVNALTSAIKLPGFPCEIYQKCFVENSEVFLNKGDSGAWILSMNGRLGAQIFASNGLQQAYGTDISTIFQDIETRLNCRVCLLDVDE